MTPTTSSAFALLVLLLQVVAVVTENSDKLVRQRRNWVVPPRRLNENQNYTHLKFIAKIRTDQPGSNIQYSLEGAGASRSPYHVFVVNHITGEVSVTRILDREFIDMYNLSGIARFRNGTMAEKSIDLRIKVVDDNDNPPVFKPMRPVVVNEFSAVGTKVMDVIATDADEPGNLNSKIAYSIISHNPPDDMFRIARNGTIYVKSFPMDRERHDQYILTVKGQDLDGAPEGHIGTGTVTINIEDANDNLPTLEKDTYEGSVMENTQGVEVMRFKALDDDLEGSENWEAVFDIVKGNEAGYFSIKTDPKTNEGILMLDKPMDHEDVENLELGVAVKNKAPYVGPGTSNGANGASGANGGGGGGGTGGGGGGGSGGTGGGTGGGGGGGSGGTGGGGGGGSGGAGSDGGGAAGSGGSGSGGGGSSGGSGTSGGSSAGGTGSAGGGGGSTSGGSGSQFKTYSVKINVKNEPEGASFDPKVKAIPISEGSQTINLKEPVAIYPAIDGDTGKPAENVRYAKGLDPDNWLTIDPETAEIRLNKIPDRESPYLINGTYFTQVFCISDDIPSKTAIGTVAIQVEDFNDHCPTLTTDSQTICTTANSAIVNADDKDVFPNGAPFDYHIVPEGTDGIWTVEHLNETAAILRSQQSMWPGIYEVEVMVKDQQNLACPEPQKMKIHVCTCEDGVVCGRKGESVQIEKEAEFGAPAIGLLLLGLLLLLLIPLLLLFCRCGSASSFPDVFNQMPFDTKTHLIQYHTEGQGENAEVPLLNVPQDIIGTAHQTFVEAPFSGFDKQISNLSINEMKMDQSWMHQMGDSDFMIESRGSQEYIFSDMALSNDFLEEYYSQKIRREASNEVKDGLMFYDDEGKFSVAGSVGCCSLLESDNDLGFLDDLGPKFRTLAEVCGGKKISNDLKPEFTAMPSAPVPSALTSESSFLTSHQSHQSHQPKLPSAITRAEQTMIRETTDSSQVMKESRATVRERMTSVNSHVGNQSQTLLLQQQPVYYTTTPMLQPVHCVVQPQFQNPMILAEAPATSFQEVVLVNGTEAGPSQGVIYQGQVMMASGQAQGPSMVLVENNGIQGSYANVIQTGNISGSQAMIVLDGNAPAGSMKVVKEVPSGLIQGGTLQRGGLSGSQTVLMVGESTSTLEPQFQEVRGVLQNGQVSGFQKVHSRKNGPSAASQKSNSSNTVKSASTVHKVVMQDTSEIH